MRVLQLRRSSIDRGRAAPRVRAAARTSAPLLAFALAACGGGSPDKRAQDAVESVRSWTATVRLAGESWLGGKVPAVYTRNTLEKADESLAQAFETLRKDGVPPILRPELGRLRAPGEAARRMAEAVGRGDTTAMRQELGALAVEDAGLEALERRLPGAGR
ncbi:MAG: hypothetical protein JO306_13115 [Gemmatimonadetes bacterium]|nr:hypothetical protein [Gemmatimonadota bacterium]